MKIDTDILTFASRLVNEFGDGAVRVSRVRLVELIAADNRRAADFWRQVLAASEELLKKNNTFMPAYRLQAETVH